MRQATETFMDRPTATRRTRLERGAGPARRAVRSAPPPPPARLGRLPRQAALPILLAVAAARVAAVAAFVSAAAAAWGGTYYLSPTGVDSASRTGSLSQPWKTITYAVTRTNPGDTIYLQAGATFSENATIGPGDGGAAALPVTITSDPANRATLAGAASSDGLSVWNTAGVIIENLILAGPGPVGATKAGVAFQTDNGKQVFVRLRNLDVSGYKNGINIFGWGGTEYGFDDIVIEDCISHHNLSGGGQTWGSTIGGITNIVVRRCVFHDNYGDPAATGNTGSGFVFGDVRGGLIEHCIAHHNGGAGVATEGPVGLWAYDSDQVTIQFCESYANLAKNMDGDGFDLDQNVTNSVIQYCYSHDNYGAGYLLCHAGSLTWGNNVVRYCISENDGCGLKMGSIHTYSASNGITNSHVYGNTIYNGKAPAVWYDANANMAANTFRNNVIVTSGGKKLLNGSPTAAKLLFQGNLWWASGGTVSIAGYSTLDAWRAATGQETLSGNSVGLFAPPLLTAPGTGGTIGDTTRLATLSAYKLQPGSPCIDTGLDLQALFGVNPGTRDFYGNALPQGAAYDLGAHELPRCRKSLDLAAGYTLIALPLDPLAPMTAETLAAQINAGGGTCTSVIEYRDGSFVTHPAGTAVQNFTLEVGKGYFVRCAAACRWEMTGYLFDRSSAPVILSAGYTLIGLPLDPDPPDKYTAERVGQAIDADGGHATQVIIYENGAFRTHPVGTAVDNFTVLTGKGCFVRCTQSSTWQVTK
jgi:hypothetical protein